jgi:hypothetical protein
MEWGDHRKRGLLGSFAQLGVALALLPHPRARTK